MKVTCDNCHGSGTRYDITCADNVNTAAQASNPCRICDGTGLVTPRAITPPRQYDPTPPLPDYLAWMTE